MLRLLWHPTNLRPEKTEKVFTLRAGEGDTKPSIKRALKWKSWFLLWNVEYIFFLTVCVVCHKMAAKQLSFEYGKGR